MTNIITIDELKNSVLNANIDDEYIQPAITEAQTIYLREILGDALLNAIVSKINGNTLTGKYLTLVNEYIKPYLSYMVQSIIVVPITYKIRNAGVIQQYDQGFTSTQMKDTQYLKDYYDGKAEFYGNRLTTYLQKNTADFPEYGYSDDNITQPTETQNVTTIYLGGGRKKGCGCNTSTPQATATTVEWDNITNRPDFAQVATSGDYEDLDNKPEIPSLEGYATETWVQEQGFSTFSGSYEDLTDKPSIPTVNDAVLTIKQGGVNKGTFSANANQNVEIDLDAGGSGSTDWDDIENKPNFATVATSGDYEDLTNKPSIPAPQVQADWQQNDSTQPDYIKNRPSMPSAQIQSDWNQTNTNEVDYIKNKPTIPAAQVQTDWNANSGMAQILNKPSLATVATSGSYPDLHNRPSLKAVATSGDYNDLTNKPTIPAAPVQSNWNESDSTSLAYIQNKPTIPAAQVQSDWNEADTSSKAYIANKPTIPAAQVNSNWNEADSSSKAYIENKPSMTTETWTFTLSDNTTVTKTVWLQPTV